MHDLCTLTLAAIGGASAWFLTSFVGGPIRRFYDLRREVNRCLVEYGNVLARHRQRRLGDDDGLVEQRIDLPAEGIARLTEAQAKFRNLAAELRAFYHRELFANWVVTKLGYDANRIAIALLGYSNEISTYGEERARLPTCRRQTFHKFL
jgi:hypothetical protein